MDHILERAVILRCVSIFSELPDDSLVELAMLLHEMTVTAGTTIFEKGDIGTCLYIIAEGQVCVHDGERTLNYMGKHAVFGEMSVLDPAPRSASVTTTADTVLLRLDRDPFYGFMRNRITVAYGMIHILCQHLRARLQDMSQDYQYIQQFARMTAAASAVEAGVYDPQMLDDVAKRTDALGQPARVFRQMAHKVVSREQQLRQQVNSLQIEIDCTRMQRQAAEITETNYFKDLQQQAQSLREEISPDQHRDDTSTGK